MALSFTERYLLLLLLASVLLQGVSQIICRLEVDSFRGLWRDTTPRPVSANDATHCIGYSYRETNLTCAQPNCWSQGTVIGDCTLYRNTDWQDLCLATCKPACNQHKYPCPGSTGLCPCQQHIERYNKARMCVPYNNLKGCDTKQVNDNNKCVPRTCIDTCINGRCDSRGLCSCITGYKPVSNTNNCVANECLSACVNGICDQFGECICKDGFKKDPYYKYNCDKIQCPGWERTNFCQRTCDVNGCSQANTECTRDGCKCKNGFKKYYQARCEPIRCPDMNEKVHCKKVCDDRCKKGQCSDDGLCRCTDGYKLDQNDSYSCQEIICPSLQAGDNTYCKHTCDVHCINGRCNERGYCECNVGFKKALNGHYLCNKINCPSPDQQDVPYCVDLCKKSCQNGVCDNKSACTCQFGFKKVPSTLYQCNQIQCPSVAREDDVHCKIKCNEHCKDGTCDDKGFCKCDPGFKKQFGVFNCVEIICPTSANEDKAYCQLKRCSKTCTNGKCDDNGACKCIEGFASTNHTKLDCHHECNLDDSCPLAAILSGIVGGGFVIVVAIFVTAAILIRTRNRKERAQKEQEAQPIPLETLEEEPEYVNCGQGWDTEERTAPGRPHRVK